MILNCVGISTGVDQLFRCRNPIWFSRGILFSQIMIDSLCETKKLDNHSQSDVIQHSTFKHTIGMYSCERPLQAVRSFTNDSMSNTLQGRSVLKVAILNYSGVSLVSCIVCQLRIMCFMLNCILTPLPRQHNPVSTKAGGPQG